MKKSLFLLPALLIAAFIFEYYQFQYNERYQALKSLKEEIVKFQSDLKEKDAILQVKNKRRPEVDVLLSETEVSQIEDFRETIAEHRVRLNELYVTIGDMKQKAEVIRSKLKRLIPNESFEYNFDKSIIEKLVMPFLVDISNEITKNNELIILYKKSLDPELKQKSLKKEIKYLIQRNALLEEEKGMLNSLFTDAAQSSLFIGSSNLLIDREIEMIRNKNLLIRAIDRATNYKNLNF